ncbi:MAG: hypothetical protein C3F06_02435 [Candidatus Methanoperedenaceae archaeon]|nr:MAG: hypothetical protein C3F06_02435 [Candidatus Methanoperedenaceae archaeon]
MSQQAGTISGEAYFAIVIISLTIIACLIILYLIVRIWGSPIFTAASSKTSGNAIIQHFQNSKIGSLLLAPINCGAIRHAKVSDGTLITTPYGINNLSGHSFVNSWNLLGISIPTFLIGGISKLREHGIFTTDHLKYLTTPQKNPDNESEFFQAKLDRYKNIITEAYDFDNFHDILEKSKDPTYINLQIEYVGDFIQSINQHYTESEITKEVLSYTMKFRDGFAATLILTSVAVFIVGLAIYIIMGV